jgi:cell division protein FtsN
MSQPSKIALFTVIGICTVALLAYGFLTSRKLDTIKESDVESNIDQFVYDESVDLQEEDDELEDLYDGKEAIDEDSDFEVYEEPGGWEDLPADTVAESNSEPAIVDIDDKDDYVEEKPTEVKVEDPEPEKETVPIESKSVLSTGNYVVVVGSYGSERNANKKLKALAEVGFEGSIDQLPGSRLQSVVAGRYTSIREAEQLANKIEDKGLHAIIRTLE